MANKEIAERAIRWAMEEYFHDEEEFTLGDRGSLGGGWYFGSCDKALTNGFENTLGSFIQDEVPVSDFDTILGRDFTEEDFEEFGDDCPGLKYFIGDIFSVLVFFRDWEED